MNLSNLLSLHYHFDLTPDASKASILLALYFIILAIFKIYLKNKINHHPEKKILKKLVKKHLNVIGILSVLGVLTITSRQLGVSLFGMRIFGEIFLLCSLVRLTLIYKGFTTGLQTKLQTITSKKKVDKYLPKTKKHKKKKK